MRALARSLGAFACGPTILAWRRGAPQAADAPPPPPRGRLPQDAPEMAQVRDVTVERLDGDARRADRDRVVVEAPL